MLQFHTFAALNNAIAAIVTQINAKIAYWSCKVTHNLRKLDFGCDAEYKIWDRPNVPHLHTHSVPNMHIWQVLRNLTAESLSPTQCLV